MLKSHFKFKHGLCGTTASGTYCTKIRYINNRFPEPKENISCFNENFLTISDCWATLIVLYYREHIAQYKDYSNETSFCVISNIPRKTTTIFFNDIYSMSKIWLISHSKSLVKSPRMSMLKGYVRMWLNIWPYGSRFVFVSSKERTNISFVRTFPRDVQKLLNANLLCENAVINFSICIPPPSALYSL